VFKIKAFETGWSESEWNSANFERVIVQYQSRIYSFIYGLVREGPLAQDLTQDTFLRAYRALCKEAANANQGATEESRQGTETAPPLITWLYKIARNAAISELRRRKVVHFTSFWQKDANDIEYETDVPAQLALIENGSEFENHYALRDELEQAIARVGRDRVTALLLHLDGYSYDEISKLTRTSLSGVKSQIFRAKQDLRRSFLTQPTSSGQQLLA
jgi:RNA polymerase sigma-70 factor (ECF subfamily)